MLYPKLERDNLGNVTSFEWESGTEREYVFGSYSTSLSAFVRWLMFPFLYLYKSIRKAYLTKVLICPDCDARMKKGYIEDKNSNQWKLVWACNCRPSRNFRARKLQAPHD